MSVTFPLWGGRTNTAMLLEQPIRALMADVQALGELAAVTVTEAWDDLVAILAELDAIDATAAAETREKARLSALHAEVRARLVTPAEAGARCTETLRGYVRGAHAKEVITHAAKVLVNGKPYCLTHAKRPTENVIRNEQYRLEQARHAGGALNDDELLIEARHNAVRARR